MDCFKEPFWICWQPKWHRCWRRPWWWRRLWQICGSGSNQSRGRQKVVASLSRHSRRPEWPVNRDLRPVFFFKCYLLVIDELCNCSSKEVDEQRRKNNDNSVDNICDGENLNRRGEYILFIYLIPSRLWASAPVEGKWQSQGKCQKRGQKDSASQNVKQTNL